MDSSVIILAKGPISGPSIGGKGVKSKGKESLEDKGRTLSYQNDATTNRRRTNNDDTRIRIFF